MQAGLQTQVAFYLTGKRADGGFDAIDGLDLRPALFAGYRDLTRLRYDFPLVLVRGGAPEASVQSLSGLFDRILGEMAAGVDGERLRQHALRIEREIRAQTAATGSAGSLSSVWTTAASRLAAQNDDLFGDSLRRLRAALKLDGDVVDCDKATPTRLLEHAWTTVQRRKSRTLQESIKRLIVKLSDILEADFLRSQEGHSAASLKASVGPAHQGVFDFEAMSRLLRKTSPETQPAESRRRRIDWLLSVLRAQRFLPEPIDIAQPSGDARPYAFAFASCEAALAAYRERLPKLAELVKAMAIAELEVDGVYDEAIHAPLFEDFAANGLDPRDAALFPDYLVCINAADISPAETATLMDILSAGLPMKILLQSDDIVERTPVGDGRLALASRSRQVASAAISLGGTYVLQSSGSSLFRLRDRIFAGLAYDGPALFSIFSGATGHAGDIPPYLVAAAATESRAFAAFVYDPSAGPDWAARFSLQENPQAERDWPVHGLAFEDEAHQRIAETGAFTLVDFLACDRRFAEDFARVPRAKWNGHAIPVAECLAQEPNGVPDKMPCLLMVDGNNVLQRVMVDSKLIREARRCADAWHSLQELGGIHNSHAARLLARERQAWEEQAKRDDGGARVDPAAGPAATMPIPVPSAPAAVAEPAEKEVERASDEPYIETPRCTSCNECTQINDKMFGYNQDKQASIVNPDAGTYRQLVEAAESCQVSIIHPGKPRNPNEAGLDELLKRAEPFL